MRVIEKKFVHSSAAALFVDWTNTHNAGIAVTIYDSPDLVANPVGGNLYIETEFADGTVTLLDGPILIASGVADMNWWPYPMDKIKVRYNPANTNAGTLYVKITGRPVR
tara:strand:+ start:631 stop:957 length:327 start_codon:yes stop_codon:yes gene_type:complete